MAKASKGNLQGNMYDKIFRENMEAALPGIIRDVLGLHIVDSVELPDEIQHTKEWKPDLLKKVTDKTGKTFVLHVEYQAKNEKEMALPDGSIQHYAAMEIQAAGKTTCYFYR